MDPAAASRLDRRGRLPLNVACSTGASADVVHLLLLSGDVTEQMEDEASPDGDRETAEKGGRIPVQMPMMRRRSESFIARRVKVTAKKENNLRRTEFSRQKGSRDVLWNKSTKGRDSLKREGDVKEPAFLVPRVVKSRSTSI
eukprot:CAMPEP_0197434078 /NCGR_PEP_ID=MMETSP1175-20131217/1848_1 /TAXON_ID=1003142 /ORGANISM="Triceratium dubium, Strain CCMP147" /LENGTH=141 /DNA_ID=CAMNT_0042962665 /DNA_START=597 /DNA_END=1022 /DNA_ORIENTATION=+